MTDDRQLVEKTLNGDMQAFRWLIKKHERLVFHMVSRIITDSQDREELCQDIFLKIYEKLNTFQGNSKLSTWIATIAYRMSINSLKKHKMEMVDIDRNSIQWPADIRTDAAMESHETKKILHYAIEQLPVSYRTVITLFHLEQMSYEEISAITNMPVGTIKSYLFRARSLLKDFLFSYKTEGAL